MVCLYILSYRGVIPGQTIVLFILGFKPKSSFLEIHSRFVLIHVIRPASLGSATNGNLYQWIDWFQFTDHFLYHNTDWMALYHTKLGF